MRGETKLKLVLLAAGLLMMARFACGGPPQAPAPPQAPTRLAASAKAPLCDKGGCDCGCKETGRCTCAVTAKKPRPKKRTARPAGQVHTWPAAPVTSGTTGYCWGTPYYAPAYRPVYYPPYAGGGFRSGGCSGGG